MSRPYITSLHGLRSNKKYDWSTSIADCTHIMVCFTIYNDIGDSDTGWTSYETIISNEELFLLLKDKCEVSVQERFN